MRPIVQISIFLFFIVSSGDLRAETLEAGQAPSGRPGVYRTATATPAIAGSWAIATGMSYGWDQDVITDGDARHRAVARLALGYSPWSFLTFSLSADGSVDTYLWNAESDESLAVGALGDPRIGLRTGIDLGAGFSIGGAFELWIPSGRGSFAVTGTSLSPSVDVMVSFTPERVPLGLHLDLGYRHDRSGQLLGNTASIAPERLLVSGATSLQHALSVAFAVEYRFGPIAPYIETLAEVPLEQDAGGTSSLRLGFGARAWFGPGDVAQLYLGMDFRVTDGAPTLDGDNGLFWDAPPLLNVQLGAVFRLPVPSPEAVAVESPPAPDLSDPASAEVAARGGRIAGVVTCGSSPCGVTARVAVGEAEVSPIAPDAESGRFATLELPAGSYNVEASAAGQQSQHRQVEVTDGATAEVTFDLPPSETAPEGSRIVGQVTDFEGTALSATILVPALNAEVETDSEGRFEIEAEPGRYDVVVSASGFRTQHSQVLVRPLEMVMMNVELRPR